jgi:hypothetical protein
MQYDMHYYGTYAMAAAAGIPKADAEIIATAAQYVDDQNFERWAITKSGEGILGVATAHHPLDAGVRALSKWEGRDDSRLVWVPFHFLPGNQGTTFEQRLITQKNSKVANAMLDFYVSRETIEAHRAHALHLMGIAAHVYADTFAHYGFSGIPSDHNLITEDSLEADSSHSSGILDYVSEQASNFKAKFTGTPRLGHGAVLTYPDRPYLKWRFKYQDGTPSVRANPETYLEGCEELHRRFVQFSSAYYGNLARTPLGWQSIRSLVKDIIEKEGKGDERVDYWMNAMDKNYLPNVEPPQVYDDQTWSRELEEFEDDGSPEQFISSAPYRFFCAADYHRGYVLKRLLPGYGLMVG